ncbi:MAG: biopolymer transporter ExbD [Kiritimatiellia bacterium]|nr:biopolymer transporter ExbD [Kiritimatiellia bacterium]MDP6848942.1 biopolymer transporter ExbD [Kiritimatiellia bacterium]
MSTESRRRSRQPETKLSMASMIAVIFLLLIFFVLAAHPRNVLSKLAVDRPTDTPGPPNPTLIEIVVSDTGLVMNGRQVSLDYVDTFLEKTAKLSSDCNVAVICASQSQHSKLIRVLDTCAAHKFHNISLLSQ